MRAPESTEHWIFFVLFRNLFHSSETRQYFGNLLGDLGITKLIIIRVSIL
jgi:hypothetical protein